MEVKTEPMRMAMVQQHGTHEAVAGLCGMLLHTVDKLPRSWIYHENEDIGMHNITKNR
jgi:hypothetical protein